VKYFYVVVQLNMLIEAALEFANPGIGANLPLK
jgi:hypothetical protein